MSEELKATIRRVNDEAWNKGNLDALDELYAADYVYHRPPFLDVEGLEAFKQYIADLRTAYADLQLTLDEIIVEGNTSTSRWTYRGTHKGRSPAFDIPPTGKQVTFTGCTVNHWVEGKIVEDWNSIGYLDLLQQLGFKIVPPPGQSEE